jgi:hypothetical protein
MEIGQNLADTIIVCFSTIVIVCLMAYAIKKEYDSENKQP